MRISKSQATTFSTYSQNSNNPIINNNMVRTIVACDDKSCKFNKAGRCSSSRIEMNSITNGSAKFICKTYEKIFNRLQ